MAYVVPHPIVVISFDGQDSTTLKMSQVIECNYVDKVHGESDELDLKFEDREGRFRNSDFGKLNNIIHVQMGYEGKPLLDCGDFQLEEVEFTGPPDQVDIRAVGTLVEKHVRTKKHRGFEDAYLSEIVYTIANEHGLRVKGNIEKIKIDRSTQNHERDLQYLLRVSRDYGYAFIIKANDLLYYKMEDLENTPAQLWLDRKELTTYEIKFQTIDTYVGSELAHHRNKAKARVEAQIGASDIRSPVPVTTPEGKPIGFLGHANDKLRVISRTQDENLARIKARAKLHEKNRQECTGVLKLPGRVTLVAGITFELSGLGVLGGPYFIDKATHNINRRVGYTTSIDIKRPPDPSKVAST